MAGFVKEASPLALTTEERILLYLGDFRGMEDRFELPEALTQRAIAYAAGTQRKHLSRYLDDLVKEGMLEQRKAHVEGQRQRMLAYYLTPKGWARAMEIKQELAALHVPIRVGTGIKEMTLEEIDGATSVRLTFSDIVREALRTDMLDLADLEKIDERRREDMDERVKKLEAYTRALMTAWKDGRVTATERLLLDQLREHLGVSFEEHERMEAEAISRAEDAIEDRIELYKVVASEASEHGAVTPRERELMEALRKALQIPRADATRVEEAVKEGSDD
ncbi:MAG: winged helix-turn-helix domain-containing protein [Methanobacteriota archaeon]|nr:MAG: winged helix-turn-helix domain-containing protein [Euryarchaeota archaeon]